MLSLAAPAAFGFLDNDVAPIRIEGRGEITEEEWEDNPTGLHVPEGKTISLVGGNIEMTKGTHYKIYEADEDGNPVYEQEEDEWGDPAYQIETDDNGEPIYDEESSPVYKTDENGDPLPTYILDDEGNPVPVSETVNAADIESPGGRINIAAVASPGEVIPAESGLDISSSERGNITLADKTFADVSGEGGGSIFIRGGNFLADDSKIRSRTLGNKDGGVIDIQADTVSLSRGAGIETDTFGPGKGSRISIRAAGPVMFASENSEGWIPYLSACSGDESHENMEEADIGDGGDVLVEAKNIYFKEGEIILDTSG